MQCRASHNLHITQLVSSVFSSCTYVVHSPSHREALVVDPGNPDIGPLLGALASAGVRQVPYILLTHEHFDHIGGVNTLRRRYPSAVVGSELCIQAITDPKKNLSAYHEGPRLICEPAEWSWEQMDWELPWRTGKVKAFPTPGHSPGGVSIAIGPALFTGDTFLGKVPSPTHLPGSNKPALRESVSRILSEFDDDTVVYPGHGMSFTLGAFRHDAAAVRAATLEN